MLIVNLPFFSFSIILGRIGVFVKLTSALQIEEITQ